MKIQDLPISYSTRISIVYLRIFAMLSIVICHIFQSIGIYELSSVFNVGVQVFFLMSGYLYGHKYIYNWKNWWAKRFAKVYFPHLVFIVIAITLIVIFKDGILRWYDIPIYILNIQGFIHCTSALSSLGIEGLNHLWFMTAIMIAYFTTPILQRFRRKAAKALFICIALLVLSHLFIPMHVVWVLEWGLLYAIGYYAAINQYVIDAMGGVKARLSVIYSLR